MHDNYGPPGRPHVIRWLTRRTATIEDERGIVALLQMTPAGAAEYEILTPPPTAEGRALLLRSLAWAREQYDHKLSGAGATTGVGAMRRLGLRRLPLGS
jgi:hypothetical protein